MRWIADLFLLTGASFMFLAALGLVRMPDVYNRIQVGTKAATLGLICLLIGLALLQPSWWPKLLLIGLLVLFTNPVGSSTIARAIYRRGIKAWGKSC